jgi:NADH dehydrogenase FAD-containing subunit
MAFVSPDAKWPYPSGYHAATVGDVPTYNFVSAAVTGYVDKWSRIETTTVEHVSTDKKEVKLANGKTLSYKALVLAPGFKHESNSIEGIEQIDSWDQSENFFNHIVDGIPRVLRN